MNVLVTGGAGYVGSHTVRELLSRKHGVVVVDNLSQGHAQALPAGIPLIVGNVWDEGLLTRAVHKYGINAIIHFAADELFKDTNKKPTNYFNSNVAGMLAVLDAMQSCGIHRIVLSSTTAIYGDSGNISVTEETPLVPSTIYGRTKFVVERMLSERSQVHPYSYVVLRYFNAAGASLDGMIGEDHSPEIHLLPLIMKSIFGENEAVEIFGTDYLTLDGTYIRDYIHVVDVANAHVRAVEYLGVGGASRVYNLGTGTGYSVGEVIDRVKGLTGLHVPVKESSRKDGAPAILLPSFQGIREELGWVSQYSDLDTIVSTAWQWHKSHPRGYERRKVLGKSIHSSSIVQSI